MIRPKLVFVSPRFLFPADEGGKIRSSNILRCLKGGRFDITLVSPAPQRDVTEFLPSLRSISDRFISWDAPSRSQLRRALSLLHYWPVSVATEISSSARQCIKRVVTESPDVVVIDFPHTAALMPDRAIEAATVIFTHNVEGEIFERHAAISRGIRRVIWRNQARKMRKFEAAVLKNTTVIAVSERDAQMLRQRYALQMVECIETGVDTEFFDFRPLPLKAGTNASGTIVFVGSMDSPANVDGVTFLMNEVWPYLVRARPKLQATIVGRNPPQNLTSQVQTRKLRWHFTGAVDDIRGFVTKADVAVIPLRVGSGTRIKAFEAMALGRPVVSTSIGVEGLSVEPGSHYLLADSPEAFANAILQLLNDGKLRNRIAKSARQRVEEFFSWERVTREFEAICDRAMQRRVAALTNPESGRLS